MQTRPVFVLAVVAVSLLTAAGLATATVGAATGTVVDQQASEQCDYVELYEETIDSVVSVEQAEGQGSGFVYDVAENGSTNYVVTNAHVVGNASEVRVQYEPGEIRTGSVIGTDVSSDLAVVEVNETPENVEPLPVADEQPAHGERVAAMGSPLGLDETITHGIVSGLNRSIPTERGFTIPNVIQTDAPISPGNSGGPLVTCDGETVGVNTAGTVAFGAENIGFAVSSTAVEQVVPALIETGEFDHPTLGISGTAVTPAVAEANDLTDAAGVMVVMVDEEAPAGDVLQGSDRLDVVDGEIVPIGGDVIVAVENQNVSTAEALASVLFAEVRPGDGVNLTIVRDGKRTNVTTTVTERPGPDTLTSDETDPGPGEPGPGEPEPDAPGPDEPGPDAPGPDEPAPETPDPAEPEPQTTETDTPVPIDTHPAPLESGSSIADE